MQIELATVGKSKSGEIYHHIWDGDSINQLLKTHELMKVDTESTESATETRPGA